MTAPAPRPEQIRCHRCQQWLGETSQALEFCGMFRDPRDRAVVEPPRETYRCKACGWVMVFRPAVPAWRTVQLKGG